MLNLSIMPLDVQNLDALCDDIIAQQKSGVSTHAMFMMKFNPEGTPPAEKAEPQCRRYDLFRERLDKAGAKHGVLVQATLGHSVIPYEPYPFQPSVNLVTGEERVVTCCPMDPSFREYIRGQFRTLAKHGPSMVMIDDDVGLLYKQTKGCGCKYHMAEFNKRAGTDMTREELCRHTQGDSDEDKYYTNIYVEVQRDGLVYCVKAMRQGLNDVDPKIQGIVSGIYTTTFCEFSDLTAEAFAGEGNPKIIRLNGGPYANSQSHGGARFFTHNIYRAAILKETTKHKVDIFLAETDTCPQNRYSTSAALLHSHFTASILEGATGAKHWITRLTCFEPLSGKAYREKLKKYSKFYEKMTEYAAVLKPFGCRIPLSKNPVYQFVKGGYGYELCPWASCVLERLGLPLYFSNDDGGAVFLDEFMVDRFDDEEIKRFLSSTVMLSSLAAEKLCVRGFTSLIGVEVRDWYGEVINGEMIGDKCLAAQYEKRELVPKEDGVEALSYVIHRDASTEEVKNLFPGVTLFCNRLGGRVVVFSGTPDMPFSYHTAFSMLNETRKSQIVKIMNDAALLPCYYPEDAEVYLRAGHLPGGEIMAALFNLSQDALDDIPLWVENEVSRVEIIDECGERRNVEFTKDGNVIRVKTALCAMTPAVLILS